VKNQPATKPTATAEKPSDSNTKPTVSPIDISGKKIVKIASNPSIVTPTNDNAPSETSVTDEESEDDYFESRILQQLPEDMYYGEMRELAEMIRRDILVSNPEVFWSDIAGLEDAKQLVQEAVVLPLKYPELFSLIPVLSQGWNGVLLFGPPGTGKTMLAKAVATECRTTFFNISASSIVSKWRGDSEKLVRVLFELADYYAPSTIFLDELDSIMSHRVSSSGGGEHEGSRRMKTELLIQMDGLSKRKGQVFVLAASNLPWDLDQAMLRRLEKRVFVGLPDEKSRWLIFKSLLACDMNAIQEEEYGELARQTEDYSGADLALVCKETGMRKLRQLMTKMAQLEQNNKPVDPVALLQMDKIAMNDVELALSVTKPSGSAYKQKYEDWQNRFGSNYSV
jgi:katanin p60 ATPase-containing subunit A1